MSEPGTDRPGPQWAAGQAGTVPAGGGYLARPPRTAGAWGQLGSRNRLLRAVARSAWMMSGADACAVVSYRDHRLVVEVGYPAAELTRGSAVVLHPSLLAQGQRALLAADRPQWAPTQPPAGFGFAYLLNGALLARRGLMVMLATEAAPLRENSLEMASARLWATAGPGGRPGPRLWDEPATGPGAELRPAG